MGKATFGHFGWTEHCHRPLSFLSHTQTHTHTLTHLTQIASTPHPQLMPRIMTHPSVATAPLDLRTTNRDCGNAGSRIPDCKGRARDAGVSRGSPAAPACTSGTDSLDSRCAQTGTARKRPADKSSSRLPFRKRPIPAEPETRGQSPGHRGPSPGPPGHGKRFCPAVDAGFTLRDSCGGGLERAADESRLVAAPVTPRRVEDAGQSPEGFPIRFLHPFEYGTYPVYCWPHVQEPNYPVVHHAEHLLADIALATRQDEDGDTALHIAVVREELGMVRKLIGLLVLARRSLDVYNNLRQTPLHLAVITRQANMVEALLRDGADPTALDRNGQTAFHLCCEYHQRDCLAVVLSHASSTCLDIRNFEGLSPLHLAVLQGHKDLARMLLVAGADINAKDIKSGQSPLMHAVESNNADMVHFLIESSCDVNSQSYSGNTALHGACGRGQVDTVRLLLKNGADSSLKNYHNDTPVMVAKNKKIADVLRGRGTNQIRLQDQHCVSVLPHGNNLTENGSPSPSHSRGSSPSTTPHTPHHSTSHSPNTPSTLIFPF